MGRHLPPVIAIVGLSMAPVALIPSAARPAGDASKPVELTPDQLKWGPDPALPAGAQYVVLQGDPRKKGPYVFRVKFPPNYRAPAHSHSDERTFTVMSGTLYNAYGDKFDETRLRAFPAGSFLTYRAGENFFAGSKDEEVIIQVSGTGPTVFTYVNPAEDPRKRK